jgi:GTP-binding protein
MLNVFEMPVAGPDAYYLLDLPGYGYARAAQTERVAFRHLIRLVIERPRLAGVLWLLDIRREPSDDDRAMQELFAERETPVLAALTKSDAVARAARTRRERGLRSALELDEDQMIVTSAREKEGIEDLRDAIAGLIHPRTA